MCVALFATSYFPTIEYISQISAFKLVRIEAKEHFQSQTNRSRCYIAGPNGLQMLTIPLQHMHRKTPVDCMIMDASNHWKENHWRSIETAYNRSAFFEYYKDELKTIFFTPELSLLEFNNNLLKFILKKSNIQTVIQSTTVFEKNTEHDFRHLSEKKNTIFSGFSAPTYPQVFGEKHAFLSNLSMLDLLFNTGKYAKDYLMKING